MIRRSSLIELNDCLSNAVTNSITYRKISNVWNNKYMVITYGFVDFDRREVSMMMIQRQSETISMNRMKTPPVKDILVEDDTLHKTFFMSSYDGRCFELSVYQTEQT